MLVETRFLITSVSLHLLAIPTAAQHLSPSSLLSEYQTEDGAATDPLPVASCFSSSVRCLLATVATHRGRTFDKSRQTDAKRHRNSNFTCLLQATFNISLAQTTHSGQVRELADKVRRKWVKEKNCINIRILTWSYIAFKKASDKTY